MISYRKATFEDLERIWDYNIAQNPDEPRNQRWKESYIRRNITGQAATFVALADGEPVGEVTLDYHAESYGKPETRSKLADGKTTAYVTALRIRKEYEGRGLASGLMRTMENSAKQLGFQTLTIGVEAEENRTQCIYQHWGYRRFLLSETDNGERILFYAKDM